MSEEMRAVGFMVGSALMIATAMGLVLSWMIGV